MSTREEMITNALQELTEHPSSSIRMVAKQYNVPESTLRYRLRGGTTTRAGHEQQQRLSRNQEEFLVEWIIEQDSQGFPPSHARTREMAIRVLRMNGETTPLGKSWVLNFIRRNPQVGSCIGRKIEAARINGTHPDLIQEFYTRY